MVVIGLRLAGMRRIDLTCLIVSPIMVGLIMNYAGSPAAVMLILLWNLAAWAPECLLLTYCNKHVSTLARCATIEL